MRGLYLPLLGAMLLLTACGATQATPSLVPPTATTTTSAATTMPADVASSVKTLPQNSFTAATPALQIGAGANVRASVATTANSATKFDAPTSAADNSGLHVSIPALSTNSQKVQGEPENWHVLLQDHFQPADPAIWQEQDIDAGSVQLTNGELQITARKGWIISSVPKPATNLEDGYIAAIFTIDGSGGGGLMARFGGEGADRQMYMCQIDNSGSFACYKYVAALWTNLISGANDAIEPDGENSIALELVGADLFFVVNGTTVAHLNDDQLTGGSFGVFANASDDDTTVHFSYAELAQPQADAAATQTATSAGPVATATRTPRVTATRTARATATRTPRATGTSGANPTRTATAQPTKAAQVVLDTNFAAGDKGPWAPLNEEGATAQFANNAFNIDITDPGNILLLKPQGTRGSADATISGDVTISGEGYIGLVGRYKSSSGGKWNMYYCVVKNTGAFTCGKDIDDKLTKITSGANADYMPDQSNHLALNVSGNNVSFSINNGKSISFSDKDLTSGAWGIMALSDYGTVSAKFTRITITNP